MKIQKILLTLPLLLTSCSSVGTSSSTPLPDAKKELEKVCINFIQEYHEHYRQTNDFLYFCEVTENVSRSEQHAFDIGFEIKFLMNLDLSHWVFAINYNKPYLSKDDITAFRYLKVDKKTMMDGYSKLFSE